MELEMKKHLLAGIALLSATFDASAALTSYNGVGGVGLVYSSVSNITWTQDANLFKTLYDADNSLISKIHAVAPRYDDPGFGMQEIGDSGDPVDVYGGDFDDFDTATGKMSWWGGIAFTSYLNSINYAGSNKWRLPASNSIFGYNGEVGNDLGQLFYGELGGTEGNSIPNTATFNNEQTYNYWLDRVFELTPLGAWLFDTNIGYQGIIGKAYQHYAWAVSPGQVAAVPVPGAAWLMGSALIGFLGQRRGNRQA